MTQVNARWEHPAISRATRKHPNWALIMHMYAFVVLNMLAIEVMCAPPCASRFFWVDRRCIEGREPGAGIDTLFDRVVAIHNRTTRQILATGVYINRALILSSFNAFRNKTETVKMDHVRLMHINTRVINDTGHVKFYTAAFTGEITCARQVIPEIQRPPSHMRHGPHVPLHDLIVIRVLDPVQFADPAPPRRFFPPEFLRKSFVEAPYGLQVAAGPLQTDLAKRGDDLEDIVYASLAHLSDHHIAQNRFMDLGQADIGDVTDCDEWLPREWGYFICLLNVNNYPGLAAGAMLFSGTKLFGVGAFALWKGASGILVFTDVRPYWDLLHRTCTENDQNLIIPVEETTTTAP